MVHTEVQTIEAVNSQVSSPKIWDKESPKANIGDYIRAPHTPVMRVIDKDIYPNGQVWLLVQPNSGSYTEEWVVDPEQETQTEFEQGFQHGRNDAVERLHPIYNQASCDYSKGYLQGYNSTRKAQQPKTPATSAAWSVTYNDKWEWYTVWVGDRVIGKASTHEKAERLGQKYIANEKVRQEHREQVLMAYAG